MPNKAKQYLYTSYYYFKAAFHNLKDKCTCCFYPVEDNDYEQQYRLDEIVVVNNDDSIDRITPEGNYNFKYLNMTSSSEELIYERKEVIEEQPKRKSIKRRHNNISNVGKKVHPKRRKYKKFENNFSGVKKEILEKELIKQEMLTDDSIILNNDTKIHNKEIYVENENFEDNLSKNKCISEEEVDENNNLKSKKFSKKKNKNKKFSTSDEEEWDIVQ